MTKNKNFPKSEVAELKDTIRSLKSKLRNREKKIEEMKGELKTLQTALDKSIIYINDELKDVPVDEVVRYFNRKRKGRLKDDFKAQLDILKARWSCWDCEIGYLTVVKINKGDETFYFRMCTTPGCNKRTKMQAWDDEVEGIMEDEKA
jgi:hypothetical protein